MNFLRLRFIATLLLAAWSFLGLSHAQSGAAAKAHVLVLGTFHMANPGRDMFNVQADDILAPKRQAEIAAFVEALKAFRPTKIAVEAPVDKPEINQKYQQYLAGKYALTTS